ncbi:hypothetical protein FHL15_005019 [Xylaria flabelliformis]|uniref:Actin-like ATPase domain-containing protein n=1 Tax=Xylaria flabelliformis TaxID=2512241 RepID=A0A553I174_9PEZI|nr:hypothetical protein FHL15_005019 [Xylaria flabelliformis]
MSPTSNLYDTLKDLSVDTDDEDEIDDRLVIGIDFGTTYSGVAWATKVDFDNNQVNLVTSWPGNGREEGKVPTELWYDDDKDEIAWGYDIPVDAERFCWFKLLLLRDEDIDMETQGFSFLVQARDMMNKSGKTAVDLVSDYMRLLWEHIMSMIERARGDSVVDGLPIHVVITVPAIWKGYARYAMKEAAKKSGILDFRLAGETKLTFAPEPEAAALPTLLEQGSGVQPGNVYVVCDAGGGTVSTKHAAYRPRRSCGLCGGVFIDQAFERICSGRLGSKWKKATKAGIRDVMKNEWEYGVKPQFKPGKAGKKYVVSLPAELFGNGNASLNDTRREPHIKNGRIYFSEDDIKRTFEGVFADIEKLVEGQIQKATKKGLAVAGIILVGGLGSSPYLYDYLKALHSKSGIAVLQSSGMRPRTAICRGAVFKGFLEELSEELSEEPGPSIRIASTISRASYGIKFRAPFRKHKHLEIDKKWNWIEGRWEANNQMDWYLTRGQEVHKLKPVRRSFYNFVEKASFDGTMTIWFYQCEDEVPPDRATLSVDILGTLQCNVDVLYSELPGFENITGDSWKKLIYEVEMVPSGASVEFAIYIDGRKQGGKSVKFSFL